MDCRNVEVEIPIIDILCFYNMLSKNRKCYRNSLHFYNIDIQYSELYKMNKISLFLEVIVISPCRKLVENHVEIVELVENCRKSPTLNLVVDNCVDNFFTTSHNFFQFTPVFDSFSP